MKGVQKRAHVKGAPVKGALWTALFLTCASIYCAPCAPIPSAQYSYVFTLQ